jgi:hypothetical protein
MSYLTGGSAILISDTVAPDTADPFADVTLPDILLLDIVLFCESVLLPHP